MPLHSTQMRKKRGKFCDRIALTALSTKKSAQSDDEIEDVTEKAVNFPPTPSECLELLDKLIQVSISNEQIFLLNFMTKRFEMAIIERKTHKTIKDYFSQNAM